MLSRLELHRKLLFASEVEVEGGGQEQIIYAFINYEKYHPTSLRWEGLPKNRIYTGLNSTINVNLVWLRPNKGKF